MGEVTAREGRHGPRAWAVVVGTLAAAVVAVGAVVAVNRWVTPSSKEATVETTTTAVDKIEVELIGNGSANKVVDRTTEAGIKVRVHITDDPNIFGFPQVDTKAPEWCQVISTAMVSAVSADAIAQTQLPITKAPGPKGSVSQFWGGQLEGSPLFGVIVQVAEDVTLVRGAIAGGGNDEMTPIKGLAALAMAAPPPAKNANPFDPPQANPSIDLIRADGSSTRVTRDALNNGPAIWSDPECQQAFNPENFEPPPPPDPPKLPPASGLTPPDPAAATAEIHEVMRTIYDKGKLADPNRIELIDDPGGIQFALDHVREFDTDKRLDKFKLEFGDLVFLNDVEASFLYTITIGDQGEIYYHQFGRARLIDGRWKITRATYCQDIAHVGWNCGP